MIYTIDTQTFNKLTQPVGNGYSVDTDGQPPTSIVIHTTNGNPGSTFEGEAKFLVNSPKVCANYLVGKAAQIAQILPPSYRAHHAGASLAAYDNSRSIGIECHHAIGEAWTPEQRGALTFLVRLSMREFNIPNNRIETHRAIALPFGRKVDPSDWSDSDFYNWRDALTPLESEVMVAIRDDIRVRSGPGTNFPIQRKINKNTVVVVDSIVTGPAIEGDTRWIRFPSNGGYAARTFFKNVL